MSAEKVFMSLHHVPAGITYLMSYTDLDFGLKKHVPDGIGSRDKYKFGSPGFYIRKTLIQKVADSFLPNEESLILFSLLPWEARLQLIWPCLSPWNSCVLSSLSGIFSMLRFCSFFKVIELITAFELLQKIHP
jgi:hypothetical protein